MKLKAMTAAGIAAMMLFSARTAQAASMRVPAGTVPLALTMKYHHPGELETLISDQSDPASPLYRKFLTADEFRRYFAPTPAEYASTVLRLRRAGYTIMGTSANRTVIDVAAPSALVDRTFSAPMTFGSRPASAGAGPRRYVVPADLPLVNAAVGVGTTTSTGFASHVASREISLLGRGRGEREHEHAFGPAVGPDGGFGPAALIKGLDFPVRHGYDGTGVKVADIIDGAPHEADIQTFLQAFGIHRTGPATTVVPVDGGNGPDPELADIDAEQIVSSAPGVSLYAYDMSAFDNIQFVHAFNQVVSDNIVDVVNTSLSRVEYEVDLALALQPIIAQGACQGIAFETVSFGGVNVSQIPDTLIPLTPADSANELDVGASNVIEDEDGHIIAQSGFLNSGGGISSIVPVFSAQSKLRGVDPNGRNVPDISFVSEVNGNGASWFIDNGWFGGIPYVSTAPVAGLLAEYQQMAHHRLGAVNRTLYHLVARHGYGNGIIDITSGCNGVYLGGPVCARRGYDLTSGIGAISNAYRLGQMLR